MRKKFAFCLVMMMLFLSGCWDQQLLKENNLVLGIGVDITDEELIKNTALIRVLKPGEGGSGRPAATPVIYEATGNTFRETRAVIEKQLAGTYAPNKLRVLVLGEDLAKKDIYPVLDIMFRDPRNSLGAKMVVAKGTAKDLLDIKKSKEVFIAEKLLESVLNAEEHTMIPTETVQSVCPDMFDPGADFALPFVVKKDPSLFEINGVALFHDKKFTGKTIEGQDASILLYMAGEEGGVARFTLEVNPKEEIHQNKYISISSYLKKHRIKVRVDPNNKIAVEIPIKINITAIEYPKNQLADEKEIKRLNKAISEELTKKAEEIIKVLQEANCDYFGIGRKIMAYHPETWKELDWAKTFPTIEIKPKIEANIIGTGIIK